MVAPGRIRGLDRTYGRFTGSRSSDQHPHPVRDQHDIPLGLVFRGLRVRGRIRSQRSGHGNSGGGCGWRMADLQKPCSDRSFLRRLDCDGLLPCDRRVRLTLGFEGCLAHRVIASRRDAAPWRAANSPISCRLRPAQTGDRELPRLRGGIHAVVRAAPSRRLRNQPAVLLQVEGRPWRVLRVWLFRGLPARPARLKVSKMQVVQGVHLGAGALARFSPFDSRL